MYLAFARVNTGGWDSRLFSRMVQLATPGARFFHSELVFDIDIDERGTLERNSFSCVMGDGCRFDYIDYGDAWELVRLPLNRTEQRIALAYARGLEGAPYDMAQLIMYPFRRGEYMSRGQICASASLLPLQEAGHWRHVEAWQYSPDTLFDLVTAEVQAAGA